MMPVLSVRTTANLALVAVLVPMAVFISRRLASKRAPVQSPRWSSTWSFFLFSLAASGYFVPGDLMGGDAHSHISRTWLFGDILSHADVPPIWTNRWYLGFPLSLYYGPFYYFVTGLLSVVLGGHVVAATKLMLWALHVVSGLTMFALGKTLTRSIAGAFFAATFYVMSFQHSGSITQAGTLPLSVIFAALPMTLLILEGVLSAPLVRQPIVAAFALALLLSLMLLTHALNGLLALLTVYAVAASRLVLVAGAMRRSVLQVLLLASALTGVFSSWFVLPLLFESHYVMLARDPLTEALGDLSRLTQRGAWLDFSSIVVWSREMQTWAYFYFGSIPLLVSLAAWAYLRDRRATPLPAYVVCWTAALLYAVVNLRFTVPFFVLTAILAALSTAALEITLRHRHPTSWQWVYPLLVVLMVLDLGLTLLPSRYRELSNSALRRLHDTLGQTLAPPRVLILYPTRATVWSDTVVMDSGIATPLGGIPQEAPFSYPYIAALAAKAATELVDQRAPLSPGMVDALRLLNVRYVFVPQDNTVVEIPTPSPVWFAPRLAPSPVSDTTLDGETWQTIRFHFEDRSLDYATPLELVHRMELAPREPGARVILRAGGVAAPPSGEEESTQEMGCRVIEHEEGHSRVRINYVCSKPGYALLAYSYFPHHVVEIDGRAAGRTFPSAMNLTAVRIPEGKHNLVLEARVSPLRRVLFAVSAVGMIGCVVWLGTIRWRARKPGIRAMPGRM